MRCEWVREGGREGGRKGGRISRVYVVGIFTAVYVYDIVEVG